MFGDYISTSIVAGSGKATTVIEIARPPTGTTFHVDSFAASLHLGHGHAAGEVAGSATAAAGTRSRAAAPPRSM
jgi:hypothetical protein